MQKLDILIYSLAKGGAEKQALILAKFLERKFSLRLILMHKNQDLQTLKSMGIKNTQIIYLENSSPKENSLKKLAKIFILGLKYKRLLQENSTQISLSFLNRPNYINVLAQIFKSPATCIISERAMPSMQHKNGLSGLINRMLIKILYKKAKLVVANSLGSTADLANFGVSRAATISNFLSASHAAPSKRFSDKFSLLSVGRLDSGKNHSFLIDCFKNTEFNLAIMGTGALQNKLEQMATPNISILGQVDKPFEHFVFDAFVFSSLYEGFPNVLQEALMACLPIVSFDFSSGARELLAPNTDPLKRLKTGFEVCEFGILVAVGDKTAFKNALNYLKNNKALQESYKTKAPKALIPYQNEPILKAWLDVLN